MNIQLSVILWTVICFSLLLLILNNLLFRPVLEVMDERKRKLSEAREKKAEYERMHKALLEERQAQLSAAEHERGLRLAASIEQIQAQEKGLLKDAQKECLERIEVYREQREKELEEILCTVSPELKKAAELFVRRMVSYKD